MGFHDPGWLVPTAIATIVSSCAFGFLFGSGFSFGLSLLYVVGSVVVVLVLLKLWARIQDVIESRQKRD